MITCVERVSSKIEIAESSDELFDESDDLVRQRRRDAPQRLREQNVQQGLAVGHADRQGGLGLPASIDCRPARTISAMNPPELNASATTPPQNAESSTPMTGSAK